MKNLILTARSTVSSSLLALFLILSIHSASAQLITSADLSDFGYFDNNAYSGDGSGFVSIPATVNASFFPFQESLTSSGLLTITLVGTTVNNRYVVGTEPATEPISSMSQILLTVGFENPVTGFTGGQILSDSLFSGNTIFTGIYGDETGSSGFQIGVQPTGGFGIGSLDVGPVGSTLTYQLTAAPEPSTWAMLLGGLLFLAWPQARRVFRR
jgi:hypothetical protein